MNDAAAWREAGVTLAIGALGAGLFWLIGFPMPFLTGPAALVSLAGLRGLPIGMPPLLRNVCFLILGINIGAGVTPEVLATAGQWPVSLALLAGLLAVSLRACRALLEQGFGFDRTSAFLAATPGHLSFVLSLATDRGLALERIAVVQSVRVLVLTICLPLALLLFGFGAGPLPAAGPPMGLWAVALLMLLAFALGLVFLRLRVPAALLLAGMAVSAIGHGSGLTPGAPAPALALGAFVVMGCLIGTRFRGIPRRQFLRDALAGVAVTLLATGLALAGALALAWVGGYAPVLLLVAYAPGGVEAMAAISVQLGLASAVVAAHHVMRLLILSVLVPAMMPRPDAAAS